MNREEKAHFDAQRKQSGHWKRWAGLQIRMAISFIGVTVLTALLLETIAFVVTFQFITNPSFVDSDTLKLATHKAEIYALKASITAGKGKLTPDATFQQGHPASLNFPGQDDANNSVSYSSTSEQPKELALIVDPGGQIYASSAPALYAPLTPVSHLLTKQMTSLRSALGGREESTVVVVSQGNVTCAAVPIWNQERQVIGAAYVQIISNKPALIIFLHFVSAWITSGAFLLIIIAPIGTLFGIITTRGLVQRIHRLVVVTGYIANGDYTRRVRTKKSDEIGYLEQQFNSMADQLGKNIALRKRLDERNARLEERSNIARELHDSVKQEAFAISMQLGAARALLERDPQAARLHLVEADTLAYQVRQELAVWIQDLRPLMLQDDGLATALRKYVTTWSRQNSIAATLDVSGECNAFPQEISSALVRLVQEALSNVARHSDASRTEVSLRCERGEVTLEISDDGHGFDISQVKGTGIGLHSMRERIEELKGTLTLQSVVGEGTRISVHCAF